MSRFGVGCRTPLGGSYRSPLGALACPGGCVSCHPSKGGATPSDATAGGMATCTDFNGTYAYSGADVLSDLCRWYWNKAGFPARSVILYYARADTTIPSLGTGCSAISMSAGEWAILLSNAFGSYVSIEKTTGFSCDTMTGKVSGTHVMPAACHDTLGCAGDSATITVAA